CVGLLGLAVEGDELAQRGAGEILDGPHVENDLTAVGFLDEVVELVEQLVAGLIAPEHRRVDAQDGHGADVLAVEGRGHGWLSLGWTDGCHSSDDSRYADGTLAGRAVKAALGLTSGCALMATPSSVAGAAGCILRVDVRSLPFAPRPPRAWQRRRRR